MGRQVYLSDEALLTIRRALSNSWSWEDSLAAAWGRQTPEGREATSRAEAAAYWMDRLFGAKPVEVKLSEDMAGGKRVGLAELMTGPEKQFGEE